MTNSALPERLQDAIDWFGGLDWSEVGLSAGIFAAALILGVVAVPLLFRLISRWVEASDTDVDDRALAYLRRPLRWLLPLIGLRLALPATDMRESAAEVIRHGLLVAIIFAVAWVLWRAILTVEEVLKSRYDISQIDNLHARKVQTQIRTLRNLAAFLLWVLAAAMALTTFDAVRQFGVTLLASAGVAGIIIGVAAQRSIATIIAGIQIAMTQPIRVDDVVIVEGEFGRIEEITLTYVVVKLWDLRRLVLPISYFIEKPFENWTRSEAKLVGSVYLQTDYSVSVDALRDELDRILEGNPLWNGETKGVAVTDCGDKSMTVRATASAANSGDAWDLRCQIRETLIAFLQREYPGSLPRLRAEVDRPKTGVDPDPTESERAA